MSEYYWIEERGVRYAINSADGDFGGPTYATRREAQQEIRRLNVEREESYSEPAHDLAFGFRDWS